ncbi:MAG: hypothetical protein SGBAC_003151 [Bacillariaceae sp.]
MPQFDKNGKAVFNHTPLARCFCNWKYCRTYQKAFREYKHPYFNGVVKLKFRQSDPRSMCLKDAVDRTLHVNSFRRNEWKADVNGEPFCRYYVAKHHFAEALIKEYLQDRRGWDWYRPLSMMEANKFLWSLNKDDVYHSNFEDSHEEDDRYVQAPNVPKEKVREMLKELRDQHRSIVSSRDDRSTSGRSVRSEDSYHSKAPSYRAKERPQENYLDKDVLSNDYNGIEDPAIASHKSTGSTRPMDIIIPVDIELVDGSADVADDKPSFDDSLRKPDNDAWSIGSQSAASKASRRSKHRTRRRTSGSQSYCSSNVHQTNVTYPVEEKHCSDSKGKNVIQQEETKSPDQDWTSFVQERQIVDPYGGKGVYTGEISKDTGIPNGRGHIDYEQEGRWYEGDWIHGRWTGTGCFSSGDGDVYEGGFYEGGFKNGRKHGEGITKFASGRVYEGEYFRGQMIEGKMTYQDGSFYDGFWVDGMQHGKGKHVFADGSEYDGEFREGNFHGNGKRVSADGSKYNGEFLEGDYHGQGKFTWNHGGWYSGEWCDGEMHGHGKEVRPDGSLRHDGEWAGGQPIHRSNSVDEKNAGSFQQETNSLDLDTSWIGKRQIVDPYGVKGVYTGEVSKRTGLPNGRGRLDYEKEGRWYEGDWIQGRWTGTGCFSNGNGDSYEGCLENDHKHGEGIMQFADGRIFEGEYIRGQMILGKMTYKDRSTYMGSWIDGMRHGKGKCVFMDGSEYEGKFREGNYHGQGKFTWNDGGWYVGEWCDGEMHGRGREIRPDGSLRHDGEWARGQPLHRSNSVN